MGKTGYHVSDQISDIKDLRTELNAIQGEVDAVETDVAGKAAEVHEHTPSQISGLLGADGKLSANYAPATMQVKFVCHSQEQQDAITTMAIGDLLARADIGEIFHWTGDRWAIATNKDLITSINGKIGAVQLTYSDVGAAAVDHTHSTFTEITTGYTHRASGEVTSHTYEVVTSADPLAYELPAGYTIFTSCRVANNLGTVVVMAETETQFNYINESGSTQYIRCTMMPQITDGNGVLVDSSVYTDAFELLGHGVAFIEALSQQPTAYSLSAVLTAEPLTTVWTPYYSGGIVNDGPLDQRGPVVFGSNVTFDAIVAASVQATDIYPTTIYGHTQSGTIIMAAFANIACATSGGTRFATATNQKIGFHNASPTVQRASAAQAAVPATPTVQQLATLVNELRAALVEKGLIKGSA